MSSTHYFQRYTQKENVATNNTLLLLSRLYQYSPSKFNAFLAELLGDSNVHAGVVFNQQKRYEDAIPDGIIEQESFKILIETKLLQSGYNKDQLINHLKGFENESNQILIALSSKKPSKTLEQQVNLEVAEFNQNNTKSVTFISTTFKDIVEIIRAQIDPYDFSFLEIISDFEDYCKTDKLILDGKSLMRVVPCGKSFDENFEYDCYYDSYDRKYSSHEYIGIYADKKIQGVGKIVNIIVASQENNELEIIDSMDIVVTDKQKTSIKALIEAAWSNNGWDISTKHRYFFVDKFYKTNFEKVTKFPLQGTKFFNLLDFLKLKKLPSTEEIAKLLNEKTW
jgi:hypothetical protein